MQLRTVQIVQKACGRLYSVRGSNSNSYVDLLEGYKSTGICISPSQLYLEMSLAVLYPEEMARTRPATGLQIITIALLASMVYE